MRYVNFLFINERTFKSKHFYFLVFPSFSLLPIVFMNLESGRICTWTDPKFVYWLLFRCYSRAFFSIFLYYFIQNCLLFIVSKVLSKLILTGAKDISYYFLRYFLSGEGIDYSLKSNYFKLSLLFSNLDVLWFIFLTITYWVADLWLALILGSL